MKKSEDHTERRWGMGTKAERDNRTNERGTHSARLVREGHHNLSFPTSARQLVPLFLWRIHVIEIGCESDSTHVNIVTHVICDTVTATFGFIGAEVTLKRYFRVSGHITRNTTYTLVLDHNNGRWVEKRTHNVA